MQVVSSIGFEGQYLTFRRKRDILIVVLFFNEGWINMALIAIIDYDMGNLRNVERALTYAGAEVRIVRTPSEAADAAGVVQSRRKPTKPAWSRFFIAS